jgi:uncharacterized protein (UPF0335 family)
MTNEETLIYDNAALRQEIEFLKKEKKLLVAAIKEISEALSDSGYDIYTSEINKILKNIL